MEGVLAKRTSVLVCGLLIVLTRAVTAEGYTMFARDIKNPDGLFEVELKLYNATTLPRLIPSAEKPQIRTIRNASLPERIITVDGSNDKYIFGSIRFKPGVEPWGMTTVILRIEIPNHPAFSERLNKIVVEMVSESKSYFLIHVPAVGDNIPDDSYELRYKILHASGIPPPTK